MPVSTAPTEPRELSIACMDTHLLNQWRTEEKNDIIRDSRWSASHSVMVYSTGRTQDADGMCYMLTVSAAEFKSVLDIGVIFVSHRASNTNTNFSGPGVYEFLIGITFMGSRAGRRDTLNHFPEPVSHDSDVYLAAYQILFEDLEELKTGNSRSRSSFFWRQDGLVAITRGRPSCGPAFCHKFDSPLGYLARKVCW